MKNTKNKPPSFTVGIIKYWNKLAGKIVGGPHAWRQWKSDVMQCEQPALVYPTLSRGEFGQYDLQRPFISPAMLWFCEENDEADAHWKLLSLHYYFFCGWCSQELQAYFEDSNKLSFEQLDRQKS